MPNIPRSGRQAYEAALQQDGLYGLRIRELTQGGNIVDAGDRPSYLPVSYVEPFDGNAALVGLDLSALGDFSPLFQDAGRSGKVAASAPVTRSLVAGTHGPVILLAFPLSPDAASTSPQGYALGVLQVQSLIDEAMGASPGPVQAAIAYAPDAQAPALVFAGGKPQALEAWFQGAVFHQSVKFDIAGRHYLLVLRTMDAADPITSLYVPLGAALLVIALAALLAQNMSTTLLRKRFVERAVVARTAQLRAANESLRDEVEQRRQAEAELRIARDRAESANRAKSSFMATMSHELRTPLNAIIGFSSLMAQGPSGAKSADDGRETDYAQEILGSGQRLLSLINDILDVTQMDSSAPGDADTLVYLSDCILSVVSDAQPAAREAGVSLQAAIADGLPAIYGDSKRLTKALAHLVANALKFTPRGGSAVASAQLDNTGHLVFDMIDTGVGMPAEAKDKIRQAKTQFYA